MQFSSTLLSAKICADTKAYQNWTAEMDFQSSALKFQWACVYCRLRFLLLFFYQSTKSWLWSKSLRSYFFFYPFSYVWYEHYHHDSMHCIDTGWLADLMTSWIIIYTNECICILLYISTLYVNISYYLLSQQIILFAYLKQDLKAQSCKQTVSNFEYMVPKA